MMNSKRLLLLSVAGIGFSATVGHTFASDDDGKDRDDRDDEGDDERDDENRNRASSAVDRGEIAPVASIIKLALAHTPGKVIDVKLRRKGEMYVYRIKILTQQARRRELFIDAQLRRVVRVK